MIANFSLNLDHLMKLFYASICNYLHFAKLDSMCHAMIDDRVKRYPLHREIRRKKIQIIVLNLIRKEFA